MDWPKKSVLVTGAGGFIGSHLVERLVALGARTRAMVRYNSSGTWGWLDDSRVRADIDVLAGDIRDRDSVQRAVSGSDVVFHLAALIGIPYSYKAPTAYVRTNVEGTLNVLQAALDREVELVVHTSTSETYGTARYVPIDEAHPLQGQSPYSASKIGADKLAQAYHLSFDLPVATIRPFNTFGPRQSARAVVPTIITQALVSDRVELGNLEPTRDMCYVADTVEGFLRVAAEPAAVGEVFNIGSGSEISVGELARTIIRLVGKDMPVVTEDRRVRPERSEVDRLLADTTAARTVLGWQPEWSLEDGLTETIEWVRNHIDRYRVGSYVI